MGWLSPGTIVKPARASIRPQAPMPNS